MDPAAAPGAPSVPARRVTFYYPTVKQPGTTTAKHKILTFSQKRQLHFRQLAKCDQKKCDLAT